MWDRAAPVPELDLGEARPDLRRFLLQQLAAGAKDEQIARALGISLRTVRRRVAGLLIELGVDSRFQAGVEAVRRRLALPSLTLGAADFAGRTMEYAAGSTCQVRCRSGPVDLAVGAHQNSSPETETGSPRR